MDFEQNRGRFSKFIKIISRGNNNRFDLNPKILIQVFNTSLVRIYPNMVGGLDARA